MDMDEAVAWFWAIIESAACDRQRLRSALEGLDRKDLRLFQQLFEQHSVELQDEQFRYYLDRASEDDMEDAANRIVSRGRGQYLQVLELPSRIAEEAGMSNDANFASVPFEVEYAKFESQGEPSTTEPDP